MARILLLLLLLPFAVSAKMLEPTAEHYAAAANSIALQRATSYLLALEALDTAIIAERERREAMISEERRLRARLVELWGAHVRRLRGEPEWPQPGDGWHEVHRGH